MDDCIFCRIAKKEILAELVYEDGSFIAFLDNDPEVDGHILLMPKAHFHTILEMPSTMGMGLISVAKKIAAELIKKGKAEGFHILANNGKAAQQVVDHVHFHILPRKKGDGVELKVVNGLRDKKTSRKMIRFA